MTSKKSKLKFLVMVLCCFFLGNCTKTVQNKPVQNKFEGSWQTSMRGLDVHLIIKGDSFIILVDGEESSRGSYNTDFKVSEENTYIHINTRYNTIYYKNFDPFIEEVSDELESKYNFLTDDNLIIERMGNFTKATIPANEIESIQNTFEKNRNNPDMRNTVINNGQVYSTLIEFSDIRMMSDLGSFENMVTEKEVKNGVCSKDVLYWTDNGLFLDVRRLRGNRNGILKNGDNISISFTYGARVAESEEDWTSAVYVGSDVSFYNQNRFGYNNYTVYGKLYFTNGNPVIEITSIIESDYI